jgi:hypothetical protein
MQIRSFFVFMNVKRKLTFALKPEASSLWIEHP